MSRPRFLVPAEDLSRAMVRLAGQEARHAEVRRLRPGEEVSLCDGRGGEALARVVALGRAGVDLEIFQRPAPLPRPAVAVTLALGIIRWERLHLAVEKAVEMGAAGIWLVRARLSQPAGAGLAGKVERAAGEAIKQCRRSFLPEVRGPLGLEDAAAESGEFPAGFYLAQGAPSLAGRLAGRPCPGPTIVFIGPEGGLTAPEEERLAAAGLVPAGLGPALLRAETAALASLALIQAAWGELSPKNERCER